MIAECVKGVVLVVTILLTDAIGRVREDCLVAAIKQRQHLPAIAAVQRDPGLLVKQVVAEAHSPSPRARISAAISRIVDKPNGHPTPKPLALMTAILTALDRDSILDPFCGSGTTLRAAKDMGLAGIGIEIEPKYCDIAVKRLRQEVLPLTSRPSLP